MANLLGSGRVVETRGNPPSSVTLRSGDKAEITLTVNGDATIGPGALIHVYDDGSFVVGDNAVPNDPSLPASDPGQDVNC